VEGGNKIDGELLGAKDKERGSLHVRGEEKKHRGMEAKIQMGRRSGGFKLRERRITRGKHQASPKLVGPCKWNREEDCLCKQREKDDEKKHKN